MKIGYLGPEGTFSEEAGKLYAKKLPSSASLMPYATIHDLLFAVDKGKVSQAVVPIENSFEGTISVVPDMLVKEVNLLICRELVLPVFHYLIAKRGTKLNKITDVVSNPPVLDQCSGFLRTRLKGAKLHLSYSSAEAVRQVSASFAGKGRVFAAIGTAASARLYGLSVIVPKINVKDNKTRFVVVAKKDHAKTGKDKTSIVFSIRQDRPGGLHDALSVFAVRRINLTKIESRPSKKALGDYYFFIDMEGHKHDAVIKAALAELKARSSFFKFLGSYPQAVAS